MAKDDGEQIVELKREIKVVRACLVEVLCDIDRMAQGQSACANMEEGSRRELNALHRRLVERLHPFTNPEADRICVRRLKLVRLALRRADIPMMRSLDALTSGEQGAQRAMAALTSVEECNAELALVTAQVNVMHEERTRMRSNALHSNNGQSEFL